MDFFDDIDKKMKEIKKEKKINQMLAGVSLVLFITNMIVVFPELYSTIDVRKGDDSRVSEFKHSIGTRYFGTILILGVPLMFLP